MADTIDGGAYLTATGQWVDATGAALSKEQAGSNRGKSASRIETYS
jgi:hypothetical protein